MHTVSGLALTGTLLSTGILSHTCIWQIHIVIMKKSLTWDEKSRSNQTDILLSPTAQFCIAELYVANDSASI